MWLVHGRKLRTSEEDRKGIMALEAAEEIEDRKLLVRAGAICAATVVGFFLQQVTGLNPAVVALAGAAVAMLVCGREVEAVFHEVEWPTILFFVGLFVVVGALEGTGPASSWASCGTRSRGWWRPTSAGSSALGTPPAATWANRSRWKAKGSGK